MTKGVTWIWHSRFLCNIALHIIQLYFHHQIDTYRAENHSCLGPAPSFLLKILVIALCFSPVAYWTPSHLGGLIFWHHIFLPFHTVHGVLQTKILEWVAISFTRRLHIVRTFIMACPSWVALHGMAHSFIELCKPLLHNKAMTHEGVFVT